ncbi:MAG: apolipoprotein N-acyltransferase, partial [Myxococcota bacterium]
DLTREAERRGVELSVWPEAAYPYLLSHEARRLPLTQARGVTSAGGGPVLFGFIAFRPEAPAERFNSASLALPTGELSESYDKMELLWFGETIPFADTFPALRRIFRRSGGLFPGERLVALTLPRPEGDLRLGVLNCYEDTLPPLGRRIASELDPHLLVNVTNDAWFEGTSEPELHLRLSAMRAVETGRDLVRAVNFGPRAWIDAYGRIRSVDRSDAAGVLVVEPSPRRGPPSIYTRWGDLSFWILWTLAAAACRRSGPAPREARAR